MSRIGKKPIPVPSGVDIHIEGQHVAVKGPRGELAWDFDSVIQIERQDGQLIVTRENDQPRVRALHGLTRSLVANMVEGVSKGFQKDLEISGVGYRAQKQAEKLVLSVGYSHPVEIVPPPGISFVVETPTR